MCVFLLYEECVLFEEKRVLYKKKVVFEVVENERRNVL